MDSRGQLRKPGYRSLAITLINGETLIDLLVQDEIGVKKKTVDYHELDESAFQAEESQEIEGVEGEVIGGEVD